MALDSRFVTIYIIIENRTEQIKKKSDRVPRAKMGAAILCEIEKHLQAP